MRILIQHGDIAEETREVENEEEAQALADYGLTVLVSGRDGGFRSLERREPCDMPASQDQEEKQEETPAAKVVSAVKKAVKKIVPANKTVKKK